jgi:hypothetical protein
MTAAKITRFGGRTICPARWVRSHQTVQQQRVQAVIRGEIDTRPELG